MVTYMLWKSYLPAKVSERYLLLSSLLCSKSYVCECFSYSMKNNITEVTRVAPTSSKSFQIENHLIILLITSQFFMLTMEY